LLMGKVTMMFMTPAPYPAANSRQSETTQTLIQLQKRGTVSALTRK
jgi:hypothetical protein